jgi:hypothetical protein
MTGRWTVDEVEEMLIEAADTLKRLPAHRPRGYISSMPTPVRSVQEMLDCEPAKLRRPPPPAAAIDRLDMVLGWMAWLEEDQIRVLWARAAGVPWRPICTRLGCGRTKAWQIWVTALVLLKVKLNDAAVALPRRVA